MRLFFILIILSSCSRVFAQHDALDSFLAHNINHARAISLFNIVYREAITVDKFSSPSLGSIATLYDGQLGDIEVKDSFLSFDGPVAKINIIIHDWRKPDIIAFSALENEDRPAIVSLIFISKDGDSRTITLERIILNKRGNQILVGYFSQVELNLPEGELKLDYQVAMGITPRLGELSLDGTGFDSKKNIRIQNPVFTLEHWKKFIGKNECSSISKKYALLHGRSSKEKLKFLLGVGNKSYKNKLIYWGESHVAHPRAKLHNLVLKVDNTGDYDLDFIKAWLLVPEDIKGKMPLVILPQQGHIFGGLEAMGVIGEKELDIASELVKHGVISLAFNSYRFTTIFDKNSTLFQIYPKWGTTAKDLHSITQLIDLVLDRSFQIESGYQIDDQKIGIWGFSYGAWISLLAATIDERIKALAYSSFHYHDADIAFGLSSSLYIPQLSCLDEWKNPLSVKKILSEINKDVLSIVPDGGMAKELQDGLKDKKIRVVINPFGHVVSEQERAEILNFFYKTFAIKAKAKVRGPSHSLPISTEGLDLYIRRENQWRSTLIKGMTSK